MADTRHHEMEGFSLGTPALVCRWRLAAGTLLLGNRAHGRDGQIVEGTLTGSQTGVLVKLADLDVTYVSATTARIDISNKTVEIIAKRIVEALSVE